MEHTAVSTLIREDEGEQEIEPLAEGSDVPRSLTGPMVPDEGPTPRRRLIREGFVVFLLALGAYFVVAWLLDMKYHSFAPDAVSRMANGFYVLYSRDPHLAAIGFVWEPLQSVADIVFLLGNHVWPALAHNDMAGSLASAVGMAGAVYQMCAALREWGVSRAPRLILTAFFAVNPMILLYGGNGMSEGIYLFTLVAATRYLLRWLHRGDLRSLAYAAIMLGVSYLSRNEAVAATLLGSVVVAAVTYRRVAGRRPVRTRAALSDVVIFAAPPVTALAGWAIASFVITGQFFQQLSSIYGTSEQLSLEKTVTLHFRVLYEVHSMDALAPVLPIVIVVAGLVAIRRGDPRVLAPLAILGGALGFDMFGYLDNAIQGALRYFIVSIPLLVMLVGSLVAAVQTTRTPQPDLRHGTRTPPRRGRMLGALVGVAIILVAMVPATATTVAGMFNPNVGIQETELLDFIVHPTRTNLPYQNNYGHILAMDEYFTSLHLPDGDIVVDNFPECVPPILTTISQPKLFVIPNDQDFERILADPITFHAHYILEADPVSFPNTAINIEYPGLWRTGSGFTKMVHQIPSRAACPAFRLFRVLHHSDEVG
jgi:hypothetical protein